MTLIAQALHAALAVLQPSQAGPLTLEEALDLATKNAFIIQREQANVEKSRQRIAIARAGMGPKVTLNGTYTRFEKATTSNFGGQQVVVQPIDSKQVSAVVTMPIDISGNLNRTVRAAKEQEAASKNTLKATVNDVRLNTKQAYFNVLRNEGLVKVAEQGLADAQERLKQARQLFAGDQIAKVDVNRFETQVAQAEADLIAARNTLRLAEAQFNFTIARPIETPVQLANIPDLPPLQASNDELVKVAEAQRPEVHAHLDNLKALALLRRALEAGMNPSLNASVQHQRNIDAQGFNSRNESTFGTLQLSLPIFDSGLTRARVRDARQDEQIAQINLDQLRLSISQEVRNAVTNLEGAMARLKNAESQVALATEVYRLAKVKQDAGAGTYVEVIDAETALTQARNQLVTARYDYLTAYAQLQRAVGSDTLTLSQGGTN